jgi:hypothetical protein
VRHIVDHERSPNWPIHGPNLNPLDHGADDLTLCGPIPLFSCGGRAVFISGLQSHLRIEVG